MRRSVKIALILAALLLSISFPLVCVLLISEAHTAKIERDLNNPIISSGYQGWEDVSIDENIRIKLPEEWTLEEQNGQFIIKNSEGEQIAVGAKLADASIESSNAFLSEIFGKKVLINQAEQFSNRNYGNLASAWFSICELEENIQVKFVSFQLPYYYDYTVRFLFFPDSTATFPCDEAEAIAYSMTYVQ